MKKLRLLFSALALLLCSTFIFAHDFYVDGIYYNITSEADKTVAVTYRGSDYDLYSNEYSGSVSIPESVTNNGTTYTVTSIWYAAFYDCDGLTSVEIPNSVTSIEIDAFYGCSGLTSIKVDEANQTYDSRNNCNAIIATETNKLIVGCKSTVIPNSVKSIGFQAFSGCSGLTSIVIPNSVTSIGSNAFSGCSGLTSIVIPNSVTSIGDRAFINCSGLTSVTIPNSVKSIGEGAFYGCSGLTSVTIPNSVTNIGYYAFYGCSGLTSVTIPNSVTSIREGAFYGCN